MKNKKKIYIVIAVISIGILLYAFFRASKVNKGIIHITAGDIDFSEAVVTKQIKQELDESYEIESNGVAINKEEEAKAIDFANEVTFLLLGAPGEEQVDYAEYKKREEEFNKIVDVDATGTKYQRTGIRYKMDRGPETTRNNIRNSVVKYKDYGKATVLNVSDDLVEVKVYMEDVTAVAVNQVNPQDVEYVTTKMELRYYMKNIYGVYRLEQIKYRLGDDIEGELEDAENNEMQNLKTNLVATNTVDTKYNSEYDYSKLKNFTDEEQKNVYNQNINNVVILKAYDVLNVTATATGVLISDGYIATSWNFFEKALNTAQLMTIEDKDGNSYNLDGVVSIDTKIDIVILKLKDKKVTTTRLGITSDLQKEDPILSIGTKTGYNLSVNIGIIAENNNNQLKNVLTTTESEAGSPVYNEQGELIAINTDQSINSSLSVANSIDDLKSVKEKLDNADFSSVKSISFDALKEKYYYNQENEEIVVNQISSKVWDEYKKVGDIENNLTLKLNKASYYNGIVSLRYENDISEYVSGIARAYKFIDELKNSGYETVHESKAKCVYRNGIYKVTIMEEMGYLIVIITKI